MTDSILAYHAAGLVDVRRGEVVPDVFVTLAGSQIIEVGRLRPNVEKIIDVGPGYLVPGMVDTHVHLAWDASAEPERVVAARPPSLTALVAGRNAATHLAHGVTTVRDVGSPEGHAVAVALAGESELIRAPRIVASGRAIAMTGGHVAGHLAREADGPTGVRTAIRDEVKLGARSIKLMASGGITGDHGEQPGVPEYTPDELGAAVDEAHRLGVPIAAHAHSREAIRNALDAGVDSIEHASDLTEEFARRMRDENVMLSATVTAVEALVRNGPDLGVPRAVLTKAEESAGRWAESTALAIRAGVRMVAGTDAGVPGQEHGTVAYEVLRLHELGLDPAAALRSATVSAAFLLRLGDRIGEIRPGFEADIIVVASNPLDDLTTLQDVRALVHRGKHYPRPADLADIPANA